MPTDDLQRLTDSLPDPYLLFDTGGTVLAANRHARRILGIGADCGDLNLRDLVSNGSVQLKNWMRMWARSPDPLPARLKWKNVDRDRLEDMRCHAFLLEPASETEAAIMAIRCSTGRSMARQLLELNRKVDHQQRLLSKLMLGHEQPESAHERVIASLLSVGDAVITTDREGIVEYLNPVAEKLTGWTADRAIGMPISRVYRIINELTRRQRPDPVIQCLHYRRRVVGTVNHAMLNSRQGTNYFVEDSAAPVFGNTGEFLGVVLVFRDATDERLARRELEDEPSRAVSSNS